MLCEFFTDSILKDINFLIQSRGRESSYLVGEVSGKTAIVDSIAQRSSILLLVEEAVLQLDALNHIFRVFADKRAKGVLGECFHYFRRECRAGYLFVLRGGRRRYP